MHCPVCNFKDTKVIDSRSSADGDSVRRRRECEKCVYRFSTGEEVELLGLAVIKSDGRREQYSREKVLRGLKRSLEKRSFTNIDLLQLIKRIERDIQKKRQEQLTSEEIGEIVMGELRNFDKVAYIRFASVYRSFEDVKTFEDELKKLVSKTKRKSTNKKK